MAVPLKYIFLNPTPASRFPALAPSDSRSRYPNNIITYRSFKWRTGQVFFTCSFTDLLSEAQISQALQALKTLQSLLQCLPGALLSLLGMSALTSALQNTEKKVNFNGTSIIILIYIRRAIITQQKQHLQIAKRPFSKSIIDAIILYVLLLRRSSQMRAPGNLFLKALPFHTKGT